MWNVHETIRTNYFMYIVHVHVHVQELIYGQHSILYM